MMLLLLQQTDLPPHSLILPYKHFCASFPVVTALLQQICDPPHSSILPPPQNTNDFEYNGCVPASNGRLWCPTWVDETGTYVSGSGAWEWCTDECPMHNPHPYGECFHCPKWVYFCATPVQYSYRVFVKSARTFHNSEKLRNWREIRIRKEIAIIFTQFFPCT